MSDSLGSNAIPVLYRLHMAVHGSRQPLENVCLGLLTPDRHDMTR